MSLDLTLPLETDAVKSLENLPKYCYFSKFFLVEELCLENDYRLLHYGRCSVIGRIQKIKNKLFLANVRVTNLPNEYSLPEGTLSIRLLPFSYFGSELKHNNFVEISGELVLLNTKNPEDNHEIPLTSKAIVEQLTFNTKNEEEHKKLLKYFHNNYIPAIKVWFVQPINRAGDLIQRNLELRMLQDQIE